MVLCMSPACPVLPLGLFNKDCFPANPTFSCSLLPRIYNKEKKGLVAGFPSFWFLFFGTVFFVCLPCFPMVFPWNSLFWIGANYHQLTSQTPLNWAGGKQSSGVWRMSISDPEHSQIKSPVHHHLAVRSQCLSPPMMESPSPPRPMSHHHMGQQSWGSPWSQRRLGLQTRCESQLQCPPRGKKLWTARAWRGAPPTAPWLRMSFLWIRNCGADWPAPSPPSFVGALLSVLFLSSAQRGLPFPSSALKVLIFLSLAQSGLLFLN